MKFYFFISNLLLCFFQLTFAQEHYVFQHLTVDDGLISNPKVNIYQDAEGYYWFSGISGFQRFDGKNFITYKYNYENKSVSGDWVTKPLEDKEKNIWIINESGINVFYRMQRVMARLYMPDAPDSNSNNVASVIKDEHEKIWIITSKNIFSYNYTSGKPVLFSNIINNKNSGIVTACYDKKRNGFWLFAIDKTNQILFFDCASKQVSHPLKKGLDEILGHANPIILFKLDESYCIWIANYLGDLCRYNTITNEVTHYNILHERNREKSGSPNSTINDCLDDGNGSIWFGGDYYVGLLKFDKRTGNFSRIQDENGTEYGLHYNEIIYNIFKDREGNIWVDTDLGINIFNPDQQQFKYLNKKTDSSITQFSSDVTSIFESKTKSIWISTWGDGIFKYDSNFVLLKNFVHDKNNPYSLGEPFNRAWCFSEDAHGRLWVGCQYGMLSILDTTTNKFANMTVPDFDRRTIMYMTTDNENNIWFGLYNGVLGKWDATGDKISTYKNLYGDNFKNFLVIHGLSQDAKNNLWVSTDSHGLNLFDEERNKMSETDFLSQNVLNICSLNDSVIIGGTSGRGLFFFNKFTKQTRYFNTADGLSSNFIFGAIPCSGNDIWIIANNGIEKLNVPSGKISNYGFTDGIRDHVFQGAFCRLKNGTILIAANSGIIYFNPDSIRSKPRPNDVAITGLNVGRQDLSVDSLLQRNTVDLSYHQDAITIDYASLSFTGRNTDEYFYSLEGIDKDWIAAGTGRSVTYANLTPGHYVFKVKCENADGVETKHSTPLDIIIYPPWWQTWWAYLLWFGIACSIVYVLYRARKRSEKALSHVRQRIASDLHDDIGSTLNSISIYSEVASQQLQSNQQNAKTLLEKIGGTSRNMIDTMNDIVWSVNPKNDQFENILQRMQFYAGELLSGKNILLQFEVEEKIKNVRLPMDRRKNFYLIFKEAILNAYKYSNSKVVKVKIGLQGNILSMIISDEGNGFDDVKESLGGNGLKNMQLRAREIHAQLNITSEKMKGTHVELNMPVK